MNKDFNKVMKTYLEWGPQRRIPIETRWREQFPEATDAEINFWTARCKEIESYAYERAQEVLDGKRDQREASEMIGKQFPELNADARGSVFSWGLYMASK